MCISAPGDSFYPTYPDSVPPTINVFLSFIGLVSYYYPILSADLRMFDVDLSIYNKIVDSYPTFYDFYLLYIFSNDDR